MNKLLAIPLVALLIACGGSLGLSESTFEDVPAVVAALDKHTLSNELTPFYQIIGAYHGRKYNVSPGDYRLEIYVYRDIDKLKASSSFGTGDSQSIIEGNLLLVLHRADQAHLDSLLADLRD